MKNIQGGIVLLVLLFSLLPSSTSPVSAIEFSSNEYWFYVDEPTLIEYPDMTFMMRNNADEELLLVCEYQEIDGINITVNLGWDNITVLPDEQVWNTYSIDVIDFVAVTIDVQIHCGFVKIGDEDTTISSAGSILNHIVFYDETIGSHVNLKIRDQSGSPRNSSIEIRYQPSADKPFSPFKFVNSSSYSAVFPNGKYLIFAKDIETGIWGQKVVDVVDDIEIVIELALVGFNRFVLIAKTYEFRGENVTALGLNASINNFVDTLFEVEIYAELFESNDNDTVISTTNIEKRSEFEQTVNYGLEMWFDLFDWNDASYVVKAYIYSLDQLIAHKHVKFSYDIDNNDNDFTAILYTLPLVFTIIAIIIKKRGLFRA